MISPSDISAARPEDQREVLEAVWDIIARTRGFAWAADNAQVFIRKLDAEAYLDAALMMVPEGCGVELKRGADELPQFIRHEHCPSYAQVFFLSRGIDEFAIGATPALALCAAILQSKGHEHE